MTEIELAYAAGIIDGEGTIGIYKHYASKSKTGIPVLRLCLSVPQCDIRLPMWFKDRFGVGYVHEHGVPKLGRRVVWSWKAWGFKQCVPILEAIRPYLMLKRDRADIALEFARQNKYIRHLSESEKAIEIVRRNSLLAQLQESNRRGVLPHPQRLSGSELRNQLSDSPSCKEFNLQRLAEMSTPPMLEVTSNE